MAEREPVNLLEYEEQAREKLSPMAFDYFFGGAGDEVTLEENRAAFQRLQLLPRVLVDVGQRDLSTTVLGQPIPYPFLIAPTAFHGLAHQEGEAATARAAGAAGTIMVLSSLSNTLLEEVAQAASGPLWFQLYVYRDRGVTRELVQRTEAAGYRALVLTVDAPLIGRRDRDARNAFALPPGLSVANVRAARQADLPQGGAGSGLAAYFATRIDASLSWQDLDWLRSITALPIVLKGLHRADDAQRAVEAGVEAIIVSNHGARQLDSVPATIEMLPPIAEAVQGRIEVLMDGGIRRGTDVVKALALGARAVLLGRPILWGLASSGQAGVERVLRLLQEELELAMALCGCARMADIERSLVVRSRA